MKMFPWLVALVLAALPLRGVGVDAEPRAVAERAVRAIADNDAVVLTRVAHPDLLRRMRSSRLVTFYLSSRNDSTDLAKASDEEVVRLFCEAHKAMAPRDSRVEYFCDYLGTDVRGEYAIVTVASGWRSRNSAQTHRSSEELVLKKSDGQWRILWSPVIAIHLDLEWDARTEIPGWAAATRAAESSSSAYPITTSDRAFLTQVLRPVNANDVAWIADHTLYPLIVRSSRGRHTVEDPQEFASILSSEPTPELVEELKAAATQRRFSNWRGIMVGRGILSFGRISSREQQPMWNHSILSIGGFAFQSSDQIVAQ